MHWTIKLDGGPRRVNHAAAAVGDKIYSFGGYSSKENSSCMRPMDVHVLNTNNLRWSLLPLQSSHSFDPLNSFNASFIEPSVPFQRYGHTAVTYGDNVYIWGGRNDTTACNILYCYNTRTNTWTTPKVNGNIPGARDAHSACVVNDCMYIFGGFEEDAEQFSQTIHMLDFRTMTWSLVPTKNPAPTNRDFHSMTAIDDKLYIFGGRGHRNNAYNNLDEIYFSNIMYFDLKDCTWHQPKTSGDKPIGRRSHSAFFYEGYLYIFGGYNGLLNEHFNQLYRFCPRKNEWQLIKAQGTPPCPRRRQTCIVINNKMFLFGGTSPIDPSENTESASVELIDHNDLHILEFSPTLRSLCLQVVCKYELKFKWLPETIKYDLRVISTPNSISRPLTSTG